LVSLIGMAASCGGPERVVVIERSDPASHLDARVAFEPRSALQTGHGFLDFETDQRIVGKYLVLEQSVFDGECYQHSTVSIPVAEPGLTPFVRVHPVLWERFEGFSRFHDRLRDGVNGGLPGLSEFTLSDLPMNLRTELKDCPRVTWAARSTSSFSVPFDPIHCKKVLGLGRNVCAWVFARDASQYAQCEATLESDLRCDMP
jgi:hypothetical protein